MTTARTRVRPAARTAARALGPFLLAAAVVAVVGAGVCGVRLLPVLTGSMAPSAPTGSLVLTVPVAGEDVAVGDVLAFRPPAPTRSWTAGPSCTGWSGSTPTPSSRG